MEQRVIDQLRRNSKTGKKVDLAKGPIGFRKAVQAEGISAGRKGRMMGRSRTR